MSSGATSAGGRPALTHPSTLTGHTESFHKPTHCLGRRANGTGSREPLTRATEHPMSQTLPLTPPLPARPRAPAHSRGRRRGAGFTLLELLVVLVILGLRAGLVGPQALRYLGGAKSDAAKLQIEELGSSLDLFHLEVGRYPKTDEGLEALVEAPPGVSNWNGPYLKKKRVPKDPWGNDYVYRSPGQHGPYDLLSYGADGAQGGEGDNEDLVSW